MKHFFTFLLLFLSIVNADEVQRIESIVNDISQLRSDYVRVQSDLAEIELQLEEEKEQTKILKQDYKNKILTLENKINSLKKSIKLKEKNKIVCKTRFPKIIKNTVIIKKSLNIQSLEDENKFPTLLMKEQFKRDEVETETVAYTYRVKTETNIYATIDGRKIAVWEESTSFTSNEQTLEWIKITGYFIDKIWRASDKEMWIKSCDTLKREH
ncbi:MAG: hypothetical protein SPLUMA2_SPLUMAMAG2_01539 [uncultured Sulfurimonas sp.]|nr:MAG: hypothetical protein SPLUMA1_SPLUMAMAG1_00741 [uncultured Sulfurimonas sp.]CAI6149339.1 MAG: hypothetical protein SPLUMA2_SPLUMAMAG2_01539 [uncultured Sulfurimonas sp.]